MKKFIISLFYFFAYFLLFYCALLIFWGGLVPSYLRPNINFMYRSYGHTNSRLDEIKEYKNIDILFLGSSHAYRGFDTRIFNEAGIKSFNLGSSAQTPLQTEILLKRHLESLNPKIILFEVFPEVFCSDGIESTLDIISNDENDFESIKLVLKQNNLKIYNTLFYSYFHSIYRNFDTKKYKKIEDVIKGEDTYIAGGYVEKKIKFFKYKSHEKYKAIFNEKQFYALQRIIEIVNKRNIKLIFIQAPSTSSYYNAQIDNIEFDHRIRSYGIYYNYNKKSKLDDSLHFYDTNHLNQNGVKIFNSDIIAFLNNDLNLKKN